MRPSSRKINTVRSYLSALFTLSLKALLQLLQTLIDLLPLTPFLITILKPTRKRQPRPLIPSNPPNPCNSLLHPNNSPPRNQLLTLTDPKLQIPHLLNILLRRPSRRTIIKDPEQSHDNSREAARQAVDGCYATYGQHGEQVLAQPGEDVEVLVVDIWRGGDEGLVVDDAVRELGADDVGVGGELFEGRGGDVEVVGYAGVVVAERDWVSRGTGSTARTC